jgi:hypothetical protein
MVLMPSKCGKILCQIQKCINDSKNCELLKAHFEGCCLELKEKEEEREACTFVWKKKSK